MLAPAFGEPKSDAEQGAQARFKIRGDPPRLPINRTYFRPPSPRKPGRSPLKLLKKLDHAALGNYSRNWTTYPVRPCSND